MFRTQSFPSFNIEGARVAPGNGTEVSLVLDVGEHELYGRVQDGDGTSIPGADVFLYWTHTADDVRSQSTRRAIADESGFFQFIGLGPGSHTVSVTAPGFRTAQLRHDVSGLADEVVVRLEEAQP